MRRPNPSWPLLNSLPELALAFVVLLLAFAVGGCKNHAHTSDPSLQPIDEMLDTQLPQGTPRSRVQFFLNSRGYRLLDSPDKNVIVAVVRHVDTKTLVPATARVTFRFDAQSQLLSYELQPAPDNPLRP